MKYYMLPAPSAGAALAYGSAWRLKAVCARLKRKFKFQQRREAMQRRIDELCQWLHERGASRQAHSGRVLLDHLRGTWGILHAAGQRAAACEAGLFHSVYGTNVFKAVTVPHGDRMAVQALIGTEAEALAWAFGQLQRPSALVQALIPAGALAMIEQSMLQLDLSLSHAQIRDLQAIECANLLEQGELWKVPALGKVAQHLGMVGAAGFALHI